MLHLNEVVGHDYPGKALIDLRAVQNFIAAHSDLTIILAHWGGGYFFFELMKEIRKLSGRVYYDTAASPFLYDPLIYQVAVTIIGEERILFGSDYPLLPPSRYFKEMESAQLAESVLKKIKGGRCLGAVVLKIVPERLRRSSCLRSGALGVVLSVDLLRFFRREHIRLTSCIYWDEWPVRSRQGFSERL